MISKYSAETRAEGGLGKGAVKPAEKRMPAPPAPEDDEDADVIIFHAAPEKVQPEQPEPEPEAVYETADEQAEEKAESTDTADISSHYSDEAAGFDTIRETPKEGHLTDEDGNSVADLPTYSVEDALSDKHFTGREELRREARRAYKRASRRNAPRKKKGSVTLGILKGVAYTLIVCCLSFFVVFGFLDFWPGVIPMANDVFAFSKGDREITVDVESGMNTEQMAELLVENGVIDEAKVFKFYVKYKYDESIGLDKDDLVGSVFHLGGEFIKTMFFGGDISPEYELEYLPGKRTLSTKMNYDQIIYALTTDEYTREEVTVTIPEGYTADQIIDLFLQNGIGTREGFEYAINEYPYKHEFVQLLNEETWSEDRTYRLEGYLFPDTYLFYRDSSEVEVINKLLNSFSERVWSEYYTTYKEACDSLGFSFDDMITFASIVQAEGRDFSDFESISQVFHNRRSSESEIFRKMESCATIQYAMDCDNAKNGITAERKPVLDGDDLLYESPYNTYMYEGLPPGAVCNPGLDAIEAALYPDMSNETKEEFNLTTAYYFNSDMAGNVYYAQTLDQHNYNKRRADAVNQQILSGTYTGQ